jgi:hypothetical protein
MEAPEAVFACSSLFREMPIEASVLSKACMGSPEDAFNFSSLSKEITVEAPALCEAKLQLPSSETSFRLVVLVFGVLCCSWSTTKLPASCQDFSGSNHIKMNNRRTEIVKKRFLKVP